MLDYAVLSTLAAVVREGSFERAAGALGVTPSAVSQRIRGLEERVGAVLVQRGQPCLATPTGAQLCAHVDRVRLLEGEVANLLPGLASAGQEGPPTLRIAVTPTVSAHGSCRLPPASRRRAAPCWTSRSTTRRTRRSGCAAARS